jgi:hypothetical protein
MKSFSPDAQNSIDLDMSADIMPNVPADAPPNQLHDDRRTRTQAGPLS